ncbi:MAG: hypothetical protein QM679_09685 [Patulibacter sp.]
MLIGGRLFITVAAAAAALIAAITGSAQAASSLGAPRVTNGDLIVDKTATIALSGFADPAATSWSTSLELDVNPASLPCASDSRNNIERRVDSADDQSVNEGNFTDATLTWAPETAGSFLLCAYLSGYNAPTVASQIAVTVRAPTTSLQLSLPGRRFAENVSVPLTAIASSEVRRVYSVEVNAIGISCGPSVEANADNKMWIWDDEIVGGPTTFVNNVTTPFAGHYHLCGYVGTGTTDATPTTVLNGPDFWAGPANCKFGGAPRRPSGRIKLTCTNTDGPITVTARRGNRTFTTRVSLSSGKGFARGRAIGLKHGARVSLSAKVDGQRSGSRVVRVR